MKGMDGGPSCAVDGQLLSDNVNRDDNEDNANEEEKKGIMTMIITTLIMAMTLTATACKQKSRTERDKERHTETTLLVTQPIKRHKDTARLGKRMDQGKTSFKQHSTDKRVSVPPSKVRVADIL